MKTHVMHPGKVTLENGDSTEITFEQLCLLYDVAPSKCVSVEDVPEAMEWIGVDHCYPRQNNDYPIFK